MQPKWDGVRVLAGVDERGVRVRSRHGTDLTGLAPAAERAIAGLPSGTLVDGEMVELAGVTGGPPVQSFAAVRHAVFAREPSPRLVFAFWDVLWAGGVELLDLAWVDRQQRLVALVGDLPSIIYSPHVAPDTEVLATWLAQGWEGVVCKRLSSRYRPGVRSPDWTKHKGRHEIQGVVVAIGRERVDGPLRVLVEAEGRADWAMTWRAPPARGDAVTVRFSRRDAGGGLRDARLA